MPLKIKEEHGGNIHYASEVLGISTDEILDFSANINPLGIPEALEKVLFSHMEALIYYPDPGYGRLRERLSEYVGVSPENVIPGNGSSEIIYLLLKAQKPENILIPAPSFSEYEQAARNAGIPIGYCKLREEENFRPALEQMAQKMMAGYQCVLLGNPNNPTSTLLSKNDLYDFIQIAARCGTTIIVDEAFIELTVGGAGNSVAELTKTFDNLFVIRAFTKIFAVPGLRLGYGIGNEQLIKEIRKMQQPWPVNSLAAYAGDFLPEAGAYLEKTKIWLEVEKDWLYKKLSAIPGLKAYIPHTNFILLKLTESGTDGDSLTEWMAQRGILIRNASGFRFLDKYFFRVAIKDHAANQRLVEAIEKFFTKK